MAFIRKNFIIAALVALSFPFPGGISAARAAVLYSVDISTDELVTIDSDTGTVNVVGALGHDAVDIDLAITTDGRLWGLSTVFATSTVNLLEIDRNTGAVLTSTSVTGAPFAEGLAAVGNQLKIGYSTPGNPSLSNQFGDLSNAGVISNTISLGVDIDGLVKSATGGTYYSIDHAPGNGTFIHELDPTVPSATLVASFSLLPPANDLVQLGNEIVFIDHTPGTLVLHSFDLASPGTLNTLAVSRSGEYLGLASADVAIPEPGAFALMALGLSGLIATRRRRNR